MTCIATDGKTMAGDGLTLTGTDAVVAYSAVKVLRLSDGSLLGCAGPAALKHKLAAWLEAQIAERNEPFPDFGDDAFSAIWLVRGLTRPECRYFNRKGGQYWTPVDLPMAIGSGSEFALGAMDAGKGPRQAVEIAMRRDIYAGGQITHLALEEPAQ